MFVFTAFAVIQSGGGQAQASPSASSSFTFPYQYGTPTVPSNVGAQGTQGPTVPLSSLGAPSNVTALMNTAPSWWNSPPSNISFTVTVYNGTLSSHSAGVGILVALYNTTTGATYSSKTNATGIASFSVPPGWYAVSATTSSSSYENFVQMIYITGGSKTIYMIPSSYATVTINNGGTGTIWAAYSSLNDLSQPPKSYPQMNISLYNTTSPNNGKLLGWGSTLSNGSVEFEGIDTALSYNIRLEGYGNPISGVLYGMVNSSGGGFTPSSNTYFYQEYNPIRYYTTSTADVSGTQIPVTNPTSFGSNNWAITQNTTVTGGTIVIGSKVFFGAPNLSLVFNHVNITIKFGGGYQGYNGNVTIQNSNVMGFSDRCGPVLSIFSKGSSSQVSSITLVNDTIVGEKYSTNGIVNVQCTRMYEINLGASSSNKNITVSGSYLEDVGSSSVYRYLQYSYVSSSMLAATYALHDTFYNSTETISNMSYSVIPDYPITTESSRSWGIGQMYQDWIDFNYTIPQLMTLNVDSVCIDPDGNWFNISYSEIDMGGMLHFGTASSITATFSHDIFSNFVLVNAVGSTTAQMFNGVYPSYVYYTNDTFSYTYYNQSAMDYISPHYYAGIGEDIEDMNVPYPKFALSYLYVMYNTFQAVPIGSSPFAPETDPVAVLLGEGNIQSNVSHNLFMNDYSYDQGPNSTLIVPYTWDIVDWAGCNYIYDNVFENLNNQIIPIGSNNNESGDQGYGSITGGHSINHIGGNLFYYAPSPIETYVPLGNMTAEASNYIGQIAYQMPTFYNDTVSLSNPQYIFNTSKMVTAPIWNLKTWTYNITPDVEILNNVPTISYSNGLAGGPQPNFIWKGYDYSESVEPSYIQVGVNSSKAPPVDLQFTGNAGEQYRIQIIDNGSLFGSFIEDASSTGVLNATYNPATMPLDPVFSATPYVSPPPPYNPVQPAPPMNFFPVYVFWILIATSAAGVSAGIYLMIRRPR
ncbi:MAG: hypothetical protein KIY10_10425 [Thermoplasmata archaeon]|nr:hypothetical protein [Candidatus Sysuiplasma jiujiangense]